MEVKLLSHSPLEVADIAICKCYSNKPHTEDDKRIKRIEKVANQQKHASVIEHLVYSFDIDGISRACLQELARHRIASYTVKSSRYTLQELKDLAGGNVNNVKPYFVHTGIDEIDMTIQEAMIELRELLAKGWSNDEVKYAIPEAYKTSLVMTVNARTLQNFLTLRTSKKALWEIQLLAKAMYEVLPSDHKVLFSNCIKD